MGFAFVGSQYHLSVGVQDSAFADGLAGIQSQRGFGNEAWPRFPTGRPRLGRTKQLCNKLLHNCRGSQPQAP